VLTEVKLDTIRSTILNFTKEMYGTTNSGNECFKDHKGPQNSYNCYCTRQW